MKKLLKKLGRVFVALHQTSEKDLRQSILLIDGSFILPNNFLLIVRGTKEKFPNAKIKALIFQDKNELLKENFPDVEIILRSQKIRRLEFVIQLLHLLRQRFAYIILSALDIIPVVFSLTFGKTKVLLHNRWLEWYRLRLRTVGDVFRGVKSVDAHPRKRNYGVKDIIKSFGRKFVILEHLVEESIKTRILIVDNGYTPVDHVTTAVRRVEETFINPAITIVTFALRKQHFIEMFPHAKIVLAGNLLASYKLAWQMYRLGKHRIDYVLLTTLDILPIIVATGLSTARTLLYNKWHQWWSLEFKNVKEYLKEIFMFIIYIPITFYLLAISSFVLLRTGLRCGYVHLKDLARKDKDGNLRTAV